MSSRSAKSKKKPDPAAEDGAKGVQLVWANPALAAIEADMCRREDCPASPRQGLVRIDSGGRVHLHPTLPTLGFARAGGPPRRNPTSGPGPSPTA